jgi:hypothetical protein
MKEVTRLNPDEKEALQEIVDAWPRARFFVAVPEGSDSKMTTLVLDSLAERGILTKTEVREGDDLYCFTNEFDAALVINAERRLAERASMN